VFEGLKCIALLFSGDTEASPSAPPMDKTTVFYIAVGVACSIILIIALAVAAIHVHSMPNSNKESRLVKYGAMMTTTVWHESFAGSNFWDFCGFFTICRKKFPQKFYMQKFTPLSKLCTNITFYTLLKPSLSFTNKTKLETKHNQK